MNEKIDIELGRTNVVIVERLSQLRLCVTCDPSDDRKELLERFKPEGKEWKVDGPLEDFGDYLYLFYLKMEHPAAR